MIVYYRLCSVPSTNPSPVFQDDKYELNKLCLKSFRDAFRALDPEVVVLADFCGEREEELVRHTLPFKTTVLQTNLGINDTCLMQYEMAAKQTKHDNILFLECDYLWSPNFDPFVYLEAIMKLGLVSPYDHPNFYKDRSIHSKTCELELVADYHFRSTERNTMTFGLTKEVLLKHLETFNKYGYLDADVWLDIAKAGQKLYVPIPSMATHMAKDWLAKGVGWEI